MKSIIRDLMTFIVFNFAMVFIAAIIGIGAEENNIAIITLCVAIILIINIFVYVGRDEKDSCLFRGYHEFFFGKE